MKVSKPIIAVLAILTFALSVYGSLFMYSHKFWGNYPLLTILSFWLGINFGFAYFNKTIFQNQGRLALSILSGLLLGKAFVYTSPLLFIAFIPLLFLKNELESLSNRAKLRTHWFYAINTFIIWNICSTYWVANAALIPGLVAFTLNSFFMTIPWITSIVFERYFPKFKGYSLIFFWISYEWIHHLWEMTWPWLSLGNGFAFYSKWIQWYDWTGTFGGSLWILCINLLLIKSYQNRQWKWVNIFGSLLILLLPVCISYYKYYTADLSGKPVEIAIVQPNYEPHFDKFAIDQRLQMLRFEALSHAALTPNTKYLIWPETSFEYIETDLFNEDWRIQRMRTIIKDQANLCLVAGLTTLKTFQDGEPLTVAARINKRSKIPRYYEIQNSAIQLTADSSKIPVYVKSKLVPGVETFPYRHLLPFLKPIVDQLGGSVQGLGIQKERDIFKDQAFAIAPVICYESIYGNYVGDYIRKGAQAIFIMTNDGWWDDTPGYRQHLAYGALRAIEFRRPIARSANTGISCFINARGDISHPLRYNQQGAIQDQLNFSNQKTVYSKTGDWIAKFCLICSLVALLFMIFKILQVRLLKNQ